MEITPYHVTLKWPHLSGSDAPEIMVNLHAETSDDLAEQLATVAAAVAEPVAKWIQNARAIAAEYDRQPVQQREPTPIRPQPAPRRTAPAANAAWRDEERYEADDDDVPARCGAGHPADWRTSNYGGLFCPADDPGEAAGKCRWVIDDKGHRRKPTKAETDAQRAANRPQGSRR